MTRGMPEVLVLGVGNLLWADEGFGVRCVEAMARDYAMADGVDLIDGGTQGLLLVNALAEARRILIFDAVDVGATPGELIIVRGDEVPRFVAGKKVSLHQTSMMEVLALAELMAEEAPATITLIGCQPCELDDYGGGLTPTVAARVPEALDQGVRELIGWGFPPQSLDAGSPALDTVTVMPEAVTRDAYEGGRPSADAACRSGDARALVRLGLQGG